MYTNYIVAVCGSLLLAEPLPPAAVNQTAITDQQSDFIENTNYDVVAADGMTGEMSGTEAALSPAEEDELMAALASDRPAEENGEFPQSTAAGFSVIFSIAVLLLGAPFLKKSAVPHNILALLYLAGAAVTVLAGTKVVGQLQDVQGLLTGNAVLVEHSDYLLMIILTFFTLFFLIYSRRALVSAWFWPDTSQVRAKARENFWLEHFKQLPPERRRIVSYHDSLIYLTTWLGLSSIGTVEQLPGVAPEEAYLDYVERTLQQFFE